MRVFTGKEAPPLLAQRWKDAGNSRKEKQQIFEVYTSCGGNVGQMLVQERLRIDRFVNSKKQKGWFTRFDLIKTYNDRADLVDDLIARKQEPGMWRYHEDFPNNEEMLEYACYDREVHSSGASAHGSKNIEWQAQVSGETAMELANSAEAMMLTHDCQPDPGTVSVSRPQRPAKKAKGRSKGKLAIADRDAAPVTSAPAPKKITIKQQTEAWYSCLMFHLKAAKELHAKLTGKRPFEALNNAIRGHIETLTKKYNNLLLLESHMPKDETEIAEIGHLRQLLEEAGDNIECGDRVTGLKRKRRELPPPITS